MSEVTAAEAMTSTEAPVPQGALPQGALPQGAPPTIKQEVVIKQEVTATTAPPPLQLQQALLNNKGKPIRVARINGARSPAFIQINQVPHRLSMYSFF